MGGFVSGRLLGPMLWLCGKRGAVLGGNLLSAIAWVLIGVAPGGRQLMLAQVLMFPFGVYHLHDIRITIGNLD
eukprot:SAG25_NODE_1156_length_3756_cov_3.235986_3_plen_73_part_00